ncbi:sulfatase family protein [Modestobacter roseus]|uniref:Putative sulfatase n=1 Tax=Modestobacter roseus TaxID=1181884 RepID=A0A562IQK4_9ACTN|nr:sulfatase [Modestobacter roseus]MQA33159.1 sulfatase-like hydrolase/transferase [Modestobacter roseus]TWH73291.1 putative sulfatase [Modestobacter roseus]
MRRPNVLWISTHDINPHLGCYQGVYPGAEYAVTPRLDQLAAEGVVYDNAFASAPVCAPSRSAIYTGCHPVSIGTMHMRTKAVPPPEVKLFTEYFRAAGYYTTNNWFTDFQVQTPGTAFDDCSETAHWRNRPTGDTPFFATFQGMITHESQIYLDDEAFAARTSHVRPEQRHDPAAAPLPPYHPDTPVFRRAWARYADLITEMDHWAGEILDQLAEDGLADDTVVVFWSEHGLGMPRGKRWSYESGLREPLIVRWPGVLAPGQRRTELIQLMDLAPTMLEVCGIPVPEHVQATPFLARDGGFLVQNEYAFGGRDRMDVQEDTCRTVRDARYRYIRNLHPDRSGMQHCEYPDHLATWAELRRLHSLEGNQLAAGQVRDVLTPLQRSVVAASKPAEELYDLQADPHETTDLATDPAHAAVLDRLRGALDRWLEEYGDLGQLPEDELLEQWRPGGRARSTDAPRVAIEDGRLVAACSTPGASIGWTTDPVGETVPAGFLAGAIGAPEQDGRYWRLYSGPVELPAVERVWVRAWRLGHAPSDAVAVAVAVD